MKGIYLTLALTKTFCDSCRGVGHSRWNCKSVNIVTDANLLTPNRKTQPIHKTTNQNNNNNKTQNPQTTTPPKTNKTTKDNVGIITSTRVGRGFILENSSTIEPTPRTYEQELDSFVRRNKAQQQQSQSQEEGIPPES